MKINDVKLYICDDDKDFGGIVADGVKAAINDGRKIDITIFNDGGTLLAEFEKSPADIVLLDIDMPVTSGFKVAEKLQNIKKDILIMFVTSHEDKVYQTYEYHPFWFIRKSHMDDLKPATEKVLLKFDAEKEKIKGEYDLLAGKQSVTIDVNKIKKIISYDHYILIEDINNEKMQVRCKMAEAEKQLSPLFFVRIQNGVIVNCRFISKVNSRFVLLKDGETINIGRGKAEKVKHEFQKFLRSR